MVVLTKYIVVVFYKRIIFQVVGGMWYVVTDDQYPGPLHRAVQECDPHFFLSQGFFQDRLLN